MVDSTTRILCCSHPLVCSVVPLQLCHAPILPAKAERCATVVEDESHDKHPIRVCCGHWYHYKCLDEFLTKPPFEKMCLVRHAGCCELGVWMKPP